MSVNMPCPDAYVRVARRWYAIKPFAVASGGFHRQIERTLDALGIGLLFTAVVCAEDYVRGKRKRPVLAV